VVEIRGAYGDLVGKLNERDLGLDGSIILKWTFDKWGMGARSGSIWLRIEGMAGVCDYDGELSGSIKCGKFTE
jgi:hypothetical protein